VTSLTPLNYWPSIDSLNFVSDAADNASLSNFADNLRTAMMKRECQSRYCYCWMVFGSAQALATLGFEIACFLRSSENLHNFDPHCSYPIVVTIPTNTEIAKVLAFAVGASDF
jgi:hypothetical protein